MPGVEFKFSVDDWIADPKVSMCSPAARGVWIDMICAMYKTRTDTLKGTVDQLARLSRCSADLCRSAIIELQATEAADVRGDAQADVIEITCRRVRRVLSGRDKANHRKERWNAQGTLLERPENDSGTHPERGRCRSICITWDLSSGFGGITTDKKSQWLLAFPGVNLEAQIARAHSWLCANPTKRKKNNERFLTNWLGRAQENGRDFASNPIQNGAAHNDYADIEAHLKAKEAAKCKPKK